MRKSVKVTFLAATLAATLLSGCGGGAGNGGAAAADVPALGPLTAQQLCSGLDGAAVGNAIGQTVTAATPSTASTPQCSYTYSAGGTTTNITIAYMRPDGDLAGNQGQAGFDYVVRTNRAMAAGATEQQVQAGQQALRLSGSSLHLGVVLTAGRVITVIAPAATPADAVDRLIQAAGEAYGR